HSRGAGRGRIGRMSTRANPVVIGGFVVGALALLVVALLVWGGTGLFRTKLEYVLFFDSAVTGLNKGGPVLGRGVKVGEVTDVQVRWGTPLVAVYITLDPKALKGAAVEGPTRAIERLVREEGLRAQLRMQSFVTGVLYVALDFRPDTPIVLRGGHQEVPEIPTIPSDIEVWTAKLERFANKIEKVPLDEIGQNVAAVLADVKGIVESKGARDLLPNANSAGNEARVLVRRVDAQIEPLVSEIKTTLAHADGTLDAVRKLALDVDTRVDPLALQAEDTLKAAQAALGDARPLIEDVRRLAAKLDAQVNPVLDSIRHTSDTARTTFERAQVTLGGV